MKRVLALASRAAATDAKVLITGESGVGKDVIARAVHAGSARAAAPFVAVNCSAFTDTLLESELFGHVRGSFTDAHRDHRGQLPRAHGGTLFLDELGETSLRMQAMLLRFLDSGEVIPVGSDQTPMRVNVRVIAATNRDLADMVVAGRFREDLLYRLRVLHIHVPPLRERRDDIVPLVQHVIRQASREVSFSPAALCALQAYRWPGNVRELHNVVEQAIFLSQAEEIGVEDLPGLVGTAPVVPARDRRRSCADRLFQELVAGASFWHHVHPLFLARDITRHDMRELVRRGLTATHGSYRRLLTLFNLPPSDYRRFLAFLTAHGCRVDYRPYRSGVRAPAVVQRPGELVNAGSTFH